MDLASKFVFLMTMYRVERDFIGRIGFFSFQRGNLEKDISDQGNNTKKSTDLSEYISPMRRN